MVPNEGSVLMVFMRVTDMVMAFASERPTPKTAAATRRGTIPAVKRLANRIESIDYQYFIMLNCRKKSRFCK